MSQEPITSTNRKNKNSSLAAFGFVLIVIILIVSAANFLRIQAPRFVPINQTEKAEVKNAAQEHPSQQPEQKATPAQDATKQGN